MRQVFSCPDQPEMKLGMESANTFCGMSGNDAGIKNIGGIYGERNERTKGKKTDRGTGTRLLLHAADTGTRQPMRVDHGQRLFSELHRETVRPLQGNHSGNGPLIKIWSFLKKIDQLGVSSVTHGGNPGKEGKWKQSIDINMCGGVPACTVCMTITFGKYLLRAYWIFCTSIRFLC